MSLDKATVARIADLARIEVPKAEQAGLAQELSQIIGWIEQLNEVDTANVEPLRAVLPIERRWRRDEVTAGGDPEAVTGNAPERHDGYFVVPRVVE